MIVMVVIFPQDCGIFSARNKNRGHFYTQYELSTSIVLATHCWLEKGLCCPPKYPSPSLASTHCQWERGRSWQIWHLTTIFVLRLPSPSSSPSLSPPSPYNTITHYRHHYHHSRLALDPLCLWQCLLDSFPSHDFFTEYPFCRRDRVKPP